MEEETDAADGIPVKTPKFITKFELARIIGMRILQLKDNTTDSAVTSEFLEQVVIQELIERKNPCVIRRYLPDGSYEDCAVKNMHFDDYSQSFVLAPNRFRRTAAQSGALLTPRNGAESDRQHR